MTGSWMFWYDDGQVQAEGAFSDGTTLREADLRATYTDIPLQGRTGDWTAYSPTGQILWQGRFRAGEPHGDHRIAVEVEEDLARECERAYPGVDRAGIGRGTDRGC